MAVTATLPTSTPTCWEDLMKYPCSAHILAQLHAVGGWDRPEYPTDRNLYQIIQDAVDSTVSRGRAAGYTTILYASLWHVDAGGTHEHYHIEAYPTAPPEDAWVGPYQAQRVSLVEIPVPFLPPLRRVTDWILPETGRRGTPHGEQAYALAQEWNHGKWAKDGEDPRWPASRYFEVTVKETA